MKRARGRDDGASQELFYGSGADGLFQSLGELQIKSIGKPHGPRSNFSAPQHISGTKTPFWGSIAFEAHRYKANRLALGAI